MHNFQLSFCLKKFGENNSIKTSASASPLDIIRTIYGPNVASHLLDVDLLEDEKLKFNMKALVSKVDFSGKKRLFLLFINNRLVESKSLKKAIFEEVYSLLPSNVQPFVYMSLQMDPMNLDVNVSPTKNEVNFLNEDAIVSKIKESIEEKLLNISETRKMYTQQLLPGASVVIEKNLEEKEKTYAKDMVRTDSKAQTIVQFLSIDSSSNSQGSQSPKAISTQINRSSTAMNRSKQREPKSELSSLNELKEEVAQCCDVSFREQISNSKFVGTASRLKVLIQIGGLLYIGWIERLWHELFYQQALEKFEHFDSIQFDESLDVSELAIIGFGMKEIGWDESDGPKDFLAKRIKAVLVEQRELLREYFNITINVDGELETLPKIIPRHMPLIAHLPVFIIRLACDVNYESEKECFKHICNELASYYAKLSLRSSDEEFLFLNETVLFPEIRKLQPPKTFLKDGTLLKLTSLQELYKVFERC